MSQGYLTPAGAIAGGVVGGVAVVAAIALFCLWLFYRRNPLSSQRVEGANLETYPRYRSTFQNIMPGASNTSLPNIPVPSLNRHVSSYLRVIVHIGLKSFHLLRVQTKELRRTQGQSMFPLCSLHTSRWDMHPDHILRRPHWPAGLQPGTKGRSRFSGPMK